MPKSVVRRVDGSLAGELPSVAEEPRDIPPAQILKTRGEPGFHAFIIRPGILTSQALSSHRERLWWAAANVVQAAMTSWLQGQWLADQDSSWCR
jgi:hypothetical protein